MGHLALGDSDLPYLLTADRCLVGFVSKNELLAFSSWLLATRLAALLSAPFRLRQ